MKPLVLLLLVCTVAAPALAAGDYLGGEIQLGGSGTGITMVTPGPTTAAAAVPAAAATGSLSVATTPAGAAIFIDGLQKDSSPALITGLSPGSHTLLLKMDGYRDLSAPVTITAGQTQTFTTTLQAAVAAATSSAPAPSQKTPGFEAVAGIAGLGALLFWKKSTQ